MHLLPLNLGVLADHADTKGGARWMCEGIELDLLPDGRYRATATDTKQLVSVTGPVVASADDYPTWPALESAPNGHTRGLIHAKGWKGFFAEAKKTAGKRGVRSELRTVAVKCGATVTTFGATDTEGQKTEAFRHMDGKFPPVQSILPKPGRGRVCVALDPRLLAKMATTMASLNDDDCSRVYVEIVDNTKPVMFYVDKADGTVATGLVMCLGERDGGGHTRAVTLDDAGEAKRTDDRVFGLGMELELARAEIARLRAELAARDAAEVVTLEAVPQAEPCRAIVKWQRPADVQPSTPVGTCHQCRKSFKYLKASGQRCTRCLKKHGAAVVRDAG